MLAHGNMARTQAGWGCMSAVGITRVVKFGGKSLCTPKLVAKAADLIAADFAAGNRVAVVVSAQGNATDAIVSQLSEVSSSISPARKPQQAWDLALSFGERLSAAVLYSALQSRGVPCKLYDPSAQDWPIISDACFGDASVDLERTHRLCNGLDAALDYVVAVVPGFVAKTAENKITTLGRGGSDLTAFLLARCIRADQIVKVTNVDGFYLDGKRVANSDAATLCMHCSKPDSKAYSRFNSLVQPRALEHFCHPTVLRIICHQSESLDAEGSTILPPDTILLQQRT